MTASGPGEPEVHRITAAPRPHSDDLEQRMARYLVSMLIRTGCVVLVLVVHGPARWVFAAGAVFLPYVAVIFANAGGRRRDGAPAVQATRRQLPAELPASSAPLEGVVQDGPRA